MITVLINSIFWILLTSHGTEVSIVPTTADTPLLTQERWNSKLFIMYSYNDGHLVTEEKNKNAFTKHHYNEKNQLTRTEYYIDPSSYSSNSNVVDAGRARKEWLIPDATTLNMIVTYEYDAKGRIIKSVDRNGYSAYQYDVNNRITKRIFYHDDIIRGGFKYYYDKNGNLVKQ